MNQLLAKVKNRKQNISEKFKKIIDNKNCYNISNINAVPYDPNILLENGQWFAIDNFSNQSYCIELLKQKAFDSVDFSLLPIDEFKKIDYLCSYQNNNFYYFQKVRATQLVTKKRLTLGQRYTYDDDNISIVINHHADAIYDKEKDKLYFQKLETILSIFKGIDILYKEATEEETEQFLNNSKIVLKNGFNATKVGKLNRKKIGLAIKLLNNYTEKQKEEIFEYTKLNSGLTVEQNKLAIFTEDDIKKLYWGITERYYETEVTKEKRVANSIININYK